MCQWSRHQVSSSTAPAKERGTLVIAYSTSTSSCPLRRVVRVSRQTCCRPGQSMWPANRVETSNCRRTTRPCSLPTVSVRSRCATRWRSFAGGKSRLKFSGNGFFERGLIVFEGEEVMSALVKDLVANLTLAEHCIAGDDPSLEYQRPQQLQCGFGFVGAIVYASLAKRAACRLIQDRQQVSDPLRSFKSAASAYAVEGNRLQRSIRIGIPQTMSDPVPNRRFKLLRRNCHQQLAKRAQLGRLALITQLMPQRGVLSMNPLGKRRVTTRPLQRGADNRGQHGREHVAQSLAPARIGNLLKMFQQTPSGSRIQRSTSLRKDSLNQVHPTRVL